MEVDLLDADTHIAIELDGGQHLGNEEAYRQKRVGLNCWHFSIGLSSMPDVPLRRIS